MMPNFKRKIEVAKLEFCKKKKCLMEWRYTLLLFKITRMFSNFHEIFRLILRDCLTKSLFIAIRAISVNEVFFVMHTFRKIGSNAKS